MIQDKAQQIAATVSGSAVGVTWIAQLQAWLQIIATVVAIIAGCLAIYSHFKKKGKK